MRQGNLQCNSTTQTLTFDNKIHNEVNNRRASYGTLFMTLTLVSVMGAFFGCSTLGDVPSELRVDSGSDPDKQDTDVRFRTTYYLRIYDSCRVDESTDRSDGTQPQHNNTTNKPSPSESTATEKHKDAEYTERWSFKVRTTGKLKIINDSLYRFRMTGKASALFSDVHFESGTLRADQVNPFGTMPEYDKTNRSYRVKLARTIGQSESEKDADDSCPEGHPAARSYLLYGPEGVKEIDPEERLLMAMSSDSKPLISLLQQLSERQLGSRINTTSKLQTFVAQRLRISRLKQQLDSTKRQLEITQKIDGSLSPERMLETFLNTIRRTSGSPEEWRYE